MLSISYQPSSTATATCPLPSYQTAHAAAMDLHAAVREPVTSRPDRSRWSAAAFAMALPDGYEAQVRPRSGLASKSGVTVVNSPGTDRRRLPRRSEVALINLGAAPFVVERGARIAAAGGGARGRARVEQVEALEANLPRRGSFGHDWGHVL
jgi:dUTP pyrophosphatase